MDRYNVGLMQEYRHCEGGRRGGCGEHNKATLTVMEREWEQVMDSFRLWAQVGAQIQSWEPECRNWRVRGTGSGTELAEVHRPT